VSEVHRLTFGAFLVRIDEDDLGGETRKQQGVRSRGPNVACTDDRDLRGLAAGHGSGV
jgi:hypothetical protein